VKTALREVRVALLEADVSLFARDFVKAVQDRATVRAVTKSIHPGRGRQDCPRRADRPPERRKATGRAEIDNALRRFLMVACKAPLKTTTTAKLLAKTPEKPRRQAACLMPPLGRQPPARW